MKKLISLLMVLTMVLSMAACAQAEPIRIGVMSGPTGMGMAQLMCAENDAYVFEIYAAPTDATADLASGALDMLCLPTNTAAALATKKDDYITVLAINCLGTLYVVSDGTVEVNTVADLAGQTVWAGVPSSTTGPILTEIFARNGVDVTLEWEADHDAVIARMAQGDIHLAVLPEPKVTVALTKVEGWQSVLNVSEAWDAVVETRLPMGCIVARNDFLAANGAEVDQFMVDYRASVAFIGNADNRQESAAMIAAAGVLPAEGVAFKALGNLQGAIVFEDGADMQADLTAFYAIIGQEQPSDAFYYAK